MACSLEAAIIEYLRNIESTSNSNPFSFTPSQLHHYTLNANSSKEKDETSPYHEHNEKDLYFSQLLGDTQQKAFKSFRKQSNKRCQCLLKQIQPMLEKKSSPDASPTLRISIDDSKKSERSFDCESSICSPTKESRLTEAGSELRSDNCQKKKCLETHTNVQSSLIMLKSLMKVSDYSDQ